MCNNSIWTIEKTAAGKICRERFVVDDAHGIGVLGKQGKGCTEGLLTNDDILIGTLGKAFGTFGAFVAGKQENIEWIIQKLGNLETAYLIDDYAEGKDTGIIDLLLIGDIDQTNLSTFVTKAEKHIRRKIRTLTMKGDEFSVMKSVFADKPMLKIW